MSTENSSSETDQQPLSAIARVDETCDAFEASWKAGRNPRIDTYLVAVAPPEQLSLLKELVPIDMHFRQLAGQPFSVAHYHQQFPQLNVDWLLLAVQRCENDRRSTHSKRVTLDQFRAAVLRLELMTEKEWAQVQDSLPDPAAVDRFAERLVKSGFLTRYQAAAIVQGKDRGLHIGDYLIQDRIGSGGMGHVFKALHRRMQRVVAIKVLLPSALKSPDMVRRFQREVHAVARLEHRNIVPAFDAGHDQGVHYLVMKYIEGQDLAKTIAQRGPLPVAEALDYILQAARGLAYAHAKGIVHRDIKPSNLLLDRERTIAILDMGLARLHSNDSTEASQLAGELTHTGEVVGTIDYLPPEQAIDTRQADARSDIYSLGCTLWHLLTGRAMYEGSTVFARILAHREHPLPSLRSYRTDVSADLDACFAKMVAKLPADRYRCMTATFADLELQRAHAENDPALQTPALRDKPVVPPALKPAAAKAASQPGLASTEIWRGPPAESEVPPADGLSGGSVFVPDLGAYPSPRRAKTAGRRRGPLIAAALGATAMISAAILLLTQADPPQITKLFPALPAAIENPPSAPSETAQFETVPSEVVPTAGAPIAEQLPRDRKAVASTDETTGPVTEEQASDPGLFSGQLPTAAVSSHGAESSNITMPDSTNAVGAAISPTSDPSVRGTAPSPAAGMATVPTLIFPLADAVLNNGSEDHKGSIQWDFGWTPARDATAYHLHVQRKGARLPIVDRDDIATTTFTFQNPGGSIAENRLQDWQWKVRARVGAEWAEWSEPRSFDVKLATINTPGDARLPSAAEVATANVRVPGLDAIDKKNPLYKLYEHLCIAGARAMPSRTNAGDEIKIAYSISGTNVWPIVLADNQQQVFGYRRHWLERLSTDGTITSIDPKAERDGRRYFLSTEIDRGKGPLPPQFIVPYMLSITTKGFPPGKYRCYIQFWSKNEKLLLETPVELELLASATEVPAPGKPPAKDEIKTASWQPNHEAGLKLVDAEDGHFELPEQAGQLHAKAKDLYLYFQVEDDFALDLPADNRDQYWLEVNLRDIGNEVFNVEYDSRSSNFSDGIWTPTECQTMTASGRWKLCRFDLPQARFANREHSVADFRLRGVQLNQLEARQVKLFRRIVKPDDEAKVDGVGGGDPAVPVAGKPAPAAIPAGKAREELKGLAAISKDDPLHELYSQVQIRRLACVPNPAEAGKPVEFYYELIGNNANLIVLRDQRLQDTGTRQHWLERLGDDSTIASYNPNAVRDGRLYAESGWTIQGQSPIPAHFVQPFTRRVETKGFPPGRYRFYIQYQANDGTVLQEQSVDFELK